MSDADALLAAIAAHPLEDTPRLVYADWLDDHGEPIRAEFIRVQCAVRRLEERPAAEQREHVRLWQRQQALIDNHRRDLLGPLGDDLSYFDATFDRGFAAELNMLAPVFLKHAAAVAALRPAPRVRVAAAGERQLGPLLACPEAAVIESLVVRDPADVWNPVPGELVAALAENPHLGRLETLDLNGTAAGDAGLHALAFGGGLPRLTELAVARCGITDAGVGDLIGSPLWARLRRIDLAANPLTDLAAEHLAAAPANPLEYLNLRRTHIDLAGHTRLLARFGGRVDLF